MLTIMSGVEFSSWGFLPVFKALQSVAFRRRVSDQECSAWLAGKGRRNLETRTDFSFIQVFWTGRRLCEDGIWAETWADDELKAPGREEPVLSCPGSWRPVPELQYQDCWVEQMGVRSGLWSIGGIINGVKCFSRYVKWLRRWPGGDTVECC